MTSAVGPNVHSTMVCSRTIGGQRHITDRNTEAHGRLAGERKAGEPAFAVLEQAVRRPLTTPGAVTRKRSLIAALTCRNYEL